MKNAVLLLLATSLLAACGHTESTKENTSKPPSDSVVANRAIAPKPKNCLSIIEPEKLGKANEYQESAKSINVALTIEKDTSTTETTGGCYFNNTVTVVATKKSGNRLFKRTLLKDDLLYFTKSDDVINRSVLQNTTYKPTFNGQKYMTLTMSLRDPVSKRTASYILFMNYFGEIVKVK